ncbi:MAG: hypothetical protein HC912_07450 [Saprospiraceae bacterium]|nr:hypothetical protein [Saprospiraceae bacterium]
MMLMGLREVSCQPYHRREIQYLQVIALPQGFDYSYKYVQRSYFEEVTKCLPPFTEALFTRDSYLTDTTYTNIAVYKAGCYYTPEQPLLAGTQRTTLLEKGILKPSNIHQNEIQAFETILLFNALIPFENAIRIPTDAVVA